ncbi:cytochrome bd-II oxidase subunit 1 [Salmonella enterica]|nr:cytochrome bd-II oxidase subunit 1 [Salmonella enterica]ECG5417473.1 cytochrome bd-II oxidase subunit 1 [Salmonella enterica subsp. enterica serovar Abaetetuba]EBO3910631.1 cytochrome bd-II oxidase subunit 1 [Salmonella enterica]ECH7300738.1 cytochrome bd-II oxidase subunit 1 [Salmonella enterica]ECO2540310.1 cytochrome bd-II oxidase subunit 1 [Salmonella enterica]
MWDVIDLSRWQFALTALYHFLFVPLTLGLIFLLAVMETIYVVTGKTVYRDMTRFWGKLFGINFALGVATGLTMEFQFGTNWSLYSNYVGDIFGAPLAMEALLAFFLESTFVGLFFFGWQRLNKYQHLLVTWLVAFGSNISALWILNANGWMQYPTGAHFNIDTLRMEMSSFSDLVFNPVSQVKFVHTVMSGYVTGAMFIMSISAWYLLRGREREVALRSFAIGSVFGTLAILGTLQLGDSSAYEVAQIQPVKLAAMEGEWQTEPAPAPFHLIAWPQQEQERNAFAVKIPALLGILATHSLDTPVPGLKNLMDDTLPRLKRGREAWLLMQEIAQGNRSPQVLNAFHAVEGDLGYGILLAKYAPDMNHVTPEQYRAAQRGAIPQVAPVFWSFRIMVGCGSLLLVVMLIALIQTLRMRIDQHRWVLRMTLWSLPLPWIAIEAGWFMTEFGRQPWAIQDHTATLFNATGIDMKALTAWQTEHKQIAGFPGAETIASDAFWRLEMDILIPAALEGQITRQRAEALTCKLVLEGANGPTYPDADDVLASRGILVVPDVVCNAGGVTVSYFEWVQDMASFFWSEEEINARMDKIMTDAIVHVWEKATEKSCSLRTAAYIVACDRILLARKDRGIYPG